ncbi:MAG TPA: helix-turn-helix domain-containing protein [Myxococcota bacterium]|nr:helix-turn-helix domain-containing protein [Myxococcota bacterium]
MDTATALAEKGGFEAVRLRDVAAQSGVALGTLYRRFRSKEDLLLAALELAMREHEARLYSAPPEGETALVRVGAFFAGLTSTLCRRPNLARALVRAIASGAPELTLRVAAFHSRTEGWITASLRGDTPDAAAPSEREHRLASSLLLVWFASLTGWASGVHDEARIVEQTRVAAALMLEAGLE